MSFAIALVLHIHVISHNMYCANISLLELLWVVLLAQV